MKKNKYLHYYHPDGRYIGDVMPFFDNGIYHLFYLLNGSGHQNINHEHAISKDLINWETVKPSIIKEYDGYEGLENGCMFTGCYFKDNNQHYHCFYTAWNPLNKEGREHIKHAVSYNLLSWTKLNTIIEIDEKYYSKARFRDFRDPCVIYDSNSKMYHMFLLANSKGKNNDIDSWDQNWVTGHYQSNDLITWVALPPIIDGLGDECPDYFEINGTHYLHGCKKYAISDNLFGPYSFAYHHSLDLPNIRAAKTLFDGKRRLWFGGFFNGPTNLPREIVQLPDKTLGLKLVDEIYKQFILVDENKLSELNKIINGASLLRIKNIKHSSNLVIQFLPTGSKLIIDFVNKIAYVIQLDGYSFSRNLRLLSNESSVELIIENDIVECYINNVDVVSFSVRQLINEIKVLIDNDAFYQWFTLNR